MPNPFIPPDGFPIGPTATIGPTAADARLVESLRAAPSRYHPGRQAAMRDLEAAVFAVVDELRARGVAPEKVLMILKAHVAAQAAHPDDLLDDVVPWCIARYYRQAASA